MELVSGGKGKILGKVKDVAVGAYHGVVGYNSVTSDTTWSGNFSAAAAGASTYSKTHSETKAGMAGLAAGQATDSISNNIKPDQSGNDYGNTTNKDGNAYGG